MQLGILYGLDVMHRRMGMQLRELECILEEN